jgi:transcriptional regulator with XRE-family HTH domain
VTDLTPALGRVVRRRRLAAGLSQERLAEAAGLHRTYVSWLERGRSSPTLDAVAAIAAALDASAAELVTEAEADARTSGRRSSA